MDYADSGLESCADPIYHSVRSAHLRQLKSDPFTQKFGHAPPSDYEVALTPNAVVGVHDVLIRHQASGAVDVVRHVELLQIGGVLYQVPAGQSQPADNVYVELKDYVQSATTATLTGVSWYVDSLP